MSAACMFNADVNEGGIYTYMYIESAHANPTVNLLFTKATQHFQRGRCIMQEIIRSDKHWDVTEKR